MARISRIVSWFRARAENLIALMLASLFVSFLIQIVFRYLLNLPLGWTVEYVALAWLWGILFGYAFVIREDEVIRLDIVYLAVPKNVQRTMDVISNAVVAAVLIWSLPKAVDYVTFMSIERTAFMRIPFDLVFSIYVPFVISVVIRSLLNVWRALRHIDAQNNERHPESGAEHV